MVKRLFAFAVLVSASILLLPSCQKIDLKGLFFPASCSVEKRIAESLDINRKKGDIILSLQSDSYRFYVSGDVHTTDYPHRFDNLMRIQRNDSAAAFGIMVGDLVTTRGAMPILAEVEKYNPSTDKFNTPTFFIVGNHDLFFNQWEDFKRLFGSSTYCFTVVTPHYKDLYIMLDSGGGCHGKSQMQWLRDQLLDRDKYRHCVVCTHVNLFRTDLSQVVSGGLPLEEVYEMVDIMTDSHVNLVLQGHDHHRKETKLSSGVTYLTLDCLKDESKNASYLIVDASSRLEYQFIDVR